MALTPRGLELLNPHLVQYVYPLNHTKSFLSQYFYPFEVWLIHFYFWFEYIDPCFTKLCNQMLSLVIGSNFHTFNTHKLQYVLISGPSDHTIQVCLGFLAIFIVIIFSRNFPLPFVSELPTNWQTTSCIHYTNHSARSPFFTHFPNKTKTQKKNPTSKL